MLFRSVTGSGTANVVLTGTLANINAYLATAANQPTYVPVTDASGTVVLTMTTNDGGNTGIDPGLSGTASSEADIDSININIIPIADPISNPGDVSVVVGAVTINTIALASSGLDGQTSVLLANGITVVSANGSPLSYSNGLDLGVRGGNADGRIEGPTEAVVLNFPSGFQ